MIIFYFKIYEFQALDSQLSDKSNQINNLEYKASDIQSSMFNQLKDVQFKQNRYENNFSKMENEQLNMQANLKDIQFQLQDYNRSSMMRFNEIDKKINDLSSKVDSILMEQTIVLKNVEGDTVKQLQLIDSKTRTVNLKLFKDIETYK